ncbi:MAG: triose-phosphate isomerase [Thermodesulfobacteriota bacterium]
MKSRIPFIAGNWKMYKTCQEATEAAAKLARLVRDVTDREVMIAPTYTALAAVSEQLKGSRIRLGAQNLHWREEGAFTGEISGKMLISAGCTHVIIGHSERRQYFGETDESVNNKIRAAVKTSLIPIFCIGETEKERDTGSTFSVLDKQVRKGLEGFSLDDLGSLLIAYEPVWAIGTGRTASKDQAQEAHCFIRSLIEKDFGPELASTVRILYGGSVKPDNIADLMGMPDIDGGLVGGASLDPDVFSKIVHY